MENNEQWLAEGNCAKCRRKNYCGKTCSAYKRTREQYMRKAFLESEQGKEFLEKYSQIKDNENE